MRTGDPSVSGEAVPDKVQRPAVLQLPGLQGMDSGHRIQALPLQPLLGMGGPAGGSSARWRNRRMPQLRASRTRPRSCLGPSFALCAAPAAAARARRQPRVDGPAGGPVETSTPSPDLLRPIRRATDPAATRPTPAHIVSPPSRSEMTIAKPPETASEAPKASQILAGGLNLMPRIQCSPGGRASRQPSRLAGLC